MGSTRIKHMAITSANSDRTVRFYESVFGLKRKNNVVTDGYVGINVNRRSPGRQAGFDHFGFEVDDIQEVEAALKQRYPGIRIASRPSTRPFASFTMHDPAGNIFDLTQRGMENRRDLYADDADLGDRSPRHVSHYLLRAVEPDRLLDFYRDVFDFGGEGYHLSDGVVTLIISPWTITDYDGSGICRPALDHLGFAVENLEQFDADLKKWREAEPDPMASWLDETSEGKARLNLFRGSCSYGQRHLADPDCVLVDVNAG